MNRLTITQRPQQLIKNFLYLALITALLQSCQSNDKAQNSQIPKSGEVVRNYKEYQSMNLATSSGKLIRAYIAKSPTEQTQGLSGVKDSEIGDNIGMIFIYDQAGPRSFWMPNTFVDLDIFFLDEKFKVLHIERKVPAHPGMKEPPAIARTPNVYATHVLELKASSPLSQEISVGENLVEIK